MASYRSRLLLLMPGELSGSSKRGCAKTYPKLPVLMTSYSEALARGQGLGRTVLSKPFSEAELLGALEQVAPNGPRRARAAITNA